MRIVWLTCRLLYYFNRMNGVLFHMWSTHPHHFAVSTIRTKFVAPAPFFIAHLRVRCRLAWACSVISLIAQLPVPSRRRCPVTGLGVPAWALLSPTRAQSSPSPWCTTVPDEGIPSVGTTVANARRTHRRPLRPHLVIQQCKHS